jgi:polysaccharide deacetylase 2 family uncharacterized protein YibQ
MVYSFREEERTINITTAGQEVEQVKISNYLGAIMTKNRTGIEEVKSRIEMAKIAFSKTKELVTTRL